MSQQTYSQAVEQYIDSINSGDLDSIVALYAEDASIEDPVGSEILQGKEAIQAFYSQNVLQAKPYLELSGPVRVAGKEAAFPFQLTVKMADRTTHIAIIDVFRFNDAGKVASMRAFWGPENCS
jgi:steroid delta-isomerase